ncbi:MAG: serine hydrolase [Bacteroidales bacterium]|nr:serine hydrolase [Bacteroidales bacterium]MDT8402368.1 serine hydrolase domain-containing protein [Bacteroidales bacterium]
MKKIIIGILILGANLLSYSQGIEFSDDLIDSIVTNFQNKWKIPGLSVAIAKDGRLIYAKGFGYADTTKKTLVTPNHLFRFSSCTKTMTSLALMQFVENGKIGVEDYVFGKNGILNSSLYSNISDSIIYLIKVKHLLRHNVGWPDIDIIGGNTASIELNLAIPAGIEENVKYFLLQKQEFDPGTKFRYANVNYFFLGQIISKLSGKTYKDYIIDDFLPGITRVFPAASSINDRHPDAVLHYDYQGEMLPWVFDTTKIVPESYSNYSLPMLADGAWIMRPIDMVRIILAMDGLDNPKDIINKETLELMTSLNTEIKKPYAMGMYVLNDRWFHTGAWSWGNGALWMKTKDNVCFAIATNTLPNTGTTEEEKYETMGKYLRELVELLPKEFNNISIYPNLDLFDEYY